MHGRVARLRSRMREHAVEALLITSAANRRYLSGFTGSAGTLLITDTATLIFTDFRYRVQVARESPAFELREISSESPLPHLLAVAAQELGLQRIAFEAEHVSVAQHNQLVDALQEHADADTPPAAPTLEPVEQMVEPLREVKDADEIATLRHAVAITDAAITAVIPQLQPEMTERQAAWMLEVALRERGADGVAFPIIVAAGPNAALPHARPDDTPLGTGRPIIIDMGAYYAGYHADLTRTITLGTPDTRFWEMYTLVLEAQQRAIAGLHAGISSLAVDALARDHITAAGYGDAFGHGLGHGVGLDIHEGPRLRRKPADPSGDEDDPPVLPAGSVFSVEPGIYLEGWGGVRIEDLVWLHADHGELLSRAPKLR
ncbi:MAG: M24 family metallopeptidase [Chloroflexaceae bacterium]